MVTVSGAETASYTINMPAQGANTFASFIMYLDTLDVPVVITDVVANVDADSGGGVDPTVGGTVTFSVDMTGVDLAGAVPIVEGSFNGYCGGCAPMSDDNNDGVWLLDIELEPGFHTYVYKLDVAQEPLAADASCASVSLGAEDENGDQAEFINRTVSVDGDAVLETVYYGGCAADYDGAGDTGTVLSGLLLTVSAPDATAVRMTGPWWTWDPAGGPEAVNNGDGTWTVGLDPVPTENMEYLWVVDGVQENLIDNAANAECAAEIDGGALITDYANYANRVHVLDSGNASDTFDACAGTGGDTGGDTGGNLVTDGTFDEATSSTWYGNAYNPVDGVNQADVGVAGNPWDVNLSGYVNVTAGSDYTLSFDVTGADRTIVAGIGQSVAPYLGHTDTVNVSATTQTIVMHLTAALDGTGDTFGGDTSRVIFDMGADAGAVSIDNVSLTASHTGTVNLGAAGDTGGDNGGDTGPVNSDVTFSVDMTGVDLTDGNPTLQSTFNSWCGACNPMSDDDGDNIWTVTVNIPQGDHEYKYALGAWVSQEAVPADCENTLGANRAVTVTGDVTLATDVYNGCPVGDTGGGDTGGTDPELTPADGFVISEAFGGTTIGDGSVYTYPAGTEAWAGFANTNTSLYPITIAEDSVITFTGSVPAGGDADVRFRFEFNPHPDVDPSFNTAAVTVSGADAATYSVDLPAQGANTFSSFLLYLNTQDVGVVVTDIVVNAVGGDTGGDTGGNLVTDGTFDEATSSTWYGNAYNPVDGVNQADVGAAGNPWDVNLSGYVNVTAGTDYTLSFDVTGADRTIVAGIGQSVAPYLGHTDTVNVSATTQTIVMHLTAKADGAGEDFGGDTTRVIFDMGADTGAVSIDNVSLTAGHTGTVNLGAGRRQWW